MVDADLVIAMLDASVDVSDEDREIINGVSGLKHLIVMNKIDIAPVELDALRPTGGSNLSATFSVSAKTGEGIEKLKTAMITPFAPGDLANTGFLVTDARHHDLLQRSREEIETSIEQFADGTSEEIVLIGLHNALRYLGQITGETTTEDMLTRIFSTFCVGK